MAASGQRARLLEAVPLALVAIMAIGVMVVTMVILERTDALRTRIAEDAEAVLSLTDSVETAVYRQSVALQSQLLAPDVIYQREYRAARALEDDALARLEQVARHAGPSAMSALSNAKLLLRRWHRTQDEFLSGEIGADTYRARLDAQSGRFQDALGLLGEIKVHAATTGAEQRDRIASLQRLGAVLTALMALASVIAAAVAYRFRGGIRESGLALVARAREAEAAVRSRDDVLAVVSHDLRNALNAMAGAVSLAQEESLPPERRAEQLALASRSARGMSRLISDLLDVARLEAGKLSVEPGVEPVAELLGHAEAGHQLEAERRGVTLVVVPPEEDAAVRADGERVAQVLGNLVGNAVKFTPEGGSVLLEARVAVDRVSFVVSDTGPGIPEEHLPRIFDRFYQVRASGRAGAGLGLAIARGLVEAHGSTLEVQSRPGEGTTFTFDLERAAAPPARPAPAAARGHVGSAPRG